MSNIQKSGILSASLKPLASAISHTEKVNKNHPLTIRQILTKVFRKIAQRSGKIVGSPWCFCFACIFVTLWLFSGPLFGFSDTWQLVINTSTTIITFLMVFLLQHTQNRDTKALHLKLDELIYVHKKARNTLLEAEDMLDDEEMQRESDGFRHKRECSEY